jgi:drug/metabolite transporter (DMT)-like permease
MLLKRVVPCLSILFGGYGLALMAFGSYRAASSFLGQSATDHPSWSASVHISLMLLIGSALAYQAYLVLSRYSVQAIGGFSAAVGVAVFIVGCNASPWLFGGAERIPGNGFWWVLGVLVVALAAYMSSYYYVCRRTLPESDAGSGSNAKT